MVRMNAGVIPGFRHQDVSARRRSKITTRRAVRFLAPVSLTLQTGANAETSGAVKGVRVKRLR
jgi:hypothetical protein